MSKAPKIEILYEDDDIVAVNKPAGLMVHSDGRQEGPFLVDWFIKKFPKAKDVGEFGRTEKGEPIERSGIVHRLDRETSGVILLAKTKEGYDHLKAQFQDRTISKRYLAYVWGNMSEEFGTIDRPIGRSSGDFRKWSAQRGTRGETREAETYWTLKKNFTVKTGVTYADGKGDAVDKFALVEAEPKTGRTHQIRVHFNAVNHPVVGDSLYAPKRPMALGFERLALHSSSIEFENVGGEKIHVDAPLPEDFKVAEKSIYLDKNE